MRHRGVILGRIRYSFSRPLVSLDVVKTKTSEGARITFASGHGASAIWGCSIRRSVDQKAIGLILDLRNNVGGYDEMAADILGFFYLERSFYEYQTCYNPKMGVFEIQMTDPETGSMGLYIEPVIALINPKCVRSGEGLAMGRRSSGTLPVRAFAG